MSSQFPATSIGRTSGARLQPTVSHEAHPLLSSPSSPQGSTTEHGNGNGGSPRYVPYTPRQRAALAATTGTIVHPPSPTHHHGVATSKLQLMNLKAAAQNVGLDTSTIGWALLETLVSEGEGEEWTEIWSAITSGKATLLLPLDQTSAHDKITPHFVRDHVVLADGPFRRGSQLVTLSGLRGIVEDDTVTFRSTIYPTSKLFQDILSPITRAHALSSLPPLPTLPNTTNTPYPKYILPSHSPSLPLPPRSHAQPKPPLPPRPGTRIASTSSTTTTSRITNPFASLFGSNNVKVPSVAAAASAPLPASPPVSIRSLDSAQDATPVIHEVPAFTIDRKIIHKDISKEMNKALKAEMKAALLAAPVPSWVADRTIEFTVDWFPFITAATTAPHLDKRNSKDKSKVYQVNPVEEVSEDAAERLQDFYFELEQDMRAHTPFRSKHSVPPSKEVVEKELESDAEDEKEREKREHEKLDSEAKIRDIMEAVERTVCSLFYDRLFMQPSTDDASHDETLSSRVAALNMLDLGLEHLDIVVGEAGPELDLVVKACGGMLTQLEECRSPGDKSAILVAAHKVVVDGLSRLPPIRLKSEEDPQTAKPTKSVLREENLKVPATEATVSKESPTDDSAIPSSSKSESPSPLPIVVDVAFSTEDEAILAKTSDDAPNSGGKGSNAPAKHRPSPLPLTGTAPPPPPRPVLKLESPVKGPTPVSGDVLLPMIIFSVVKANPPHLVSNLLFTQRFRNQSIGGEESYCLINLMAVADFLENVDLAALGLVDSDKVMSAAELTPIPLTRSPVTTETPLSLAEGLQGSLRGRMEQQVDAIADSANKVITGVVDSSFGILRSFLPQNNVAPNPAAAQRPTTPGQQQPGSGGKPGLGLLRRESGFSIASIAASLPIPSRKPTTGAEEAGQQLVSVSQPGSVRSRRSSFKVQVDGEESQEEEDVDPYAHDSEATGDEEEGEDADEDGDDALSVGGGDTRSIQSFEAMMSASKSKKVKVRPKGKNSPGRGTRKSLSDRLANMSALASLKGSPPTSRRSSLVQPPISQLPHTTPPPSRPASPFSSRLAPPIQRFVTCTADELRLSEVGELLRDYRRIVEGIRAMGGFDE